MKGGRLAFLHIQFEHAFGGASPQRFEEMTFLLRRFHTVDDLGPRRQVLQHLALGAAKQKGGHQPAQLLPGGDVAVLLDRVGEALVELAGRAEQAGVDHVHDGPQVGQAVFHRRARQGEAKARGDAGHRARALGGGVLEGLRLVHHQRAPWAS